MKKKHFRSSVLIFIILIVTLACNLGSGPAATQPPAPATVLPVVDSAPVSSAEPSVQHVMIPPAVLPSTRSGLAGDYDSSTTATEQRAPGGDRFTFDRFERPFSATTMDVYYPYLDIQNSIFYQDEAWLFGVIALKDYEATQSPVGKYGYEMDLNVDGGGDWLIMAVQPASTEWSTDGVQVWFDTNDDVGGSLKALTDKEPVPVDGYETMAFGDGQGDDLDLAWARVSPDDPNIVEIAVKKSILDGDNTFLVGMWAGGDDFAPALFDVNDLFTHEQAGTSLQELEFYYPIKEISELDNACRMAIGFEPRGDEPGLCEKLDSPPGPGDPPWTCPLTANMCYQQNMDFDSRNCVCVPFG